MQSSEIIQTALRTITLQADALSHLKSYVDETFEEVVKAIAQMQGRMVISGIGKSAIIAQKIVATFNSTGTPAIFMHAADAIHGDLGIVQPGDIVMVISKSGDSPEIKVLVPLVKNFGNLLVGMTGNMQSFLAQNADKVLNTTVSQEACPNNLAPTTSTTAQMVMGDALAVCLMDLKGFRKEHFARFHPGGSLGKRLYLRVQDVMSNQKPSVVAESGIKEVIVEMTRSRLGATAVVNNQGELIGIITDGDVRRMLENNDSIARLTAGDIMIRTPKTIAAEEMAAEALEVMRKNNINQLLVVNQQQQYTGIVHLQEIIREGII
ncbi:MAG TPA: KpsF/GutQ family sugar-phosphate isomerase [Ferruginibacter sp.]|nr:KpsF/GutQ family sugar-phosphate isomerase [Ferruginibacter sp.]HRO06905.1 KpsF/GutQ family sugar-phosphate isomerase [Ferruginibacter sp.]HRO96932.1 KpsF/GutQ family sugar-phosphate isomerase [Ferruginibacter sp.]HRP50030.1 KpsF/GutQ family sugar-phosphate isomerase [Ferruginibacter sp.]